MQRLLYKLKILANRHLVRLNKENMVCHRLGSTSLKSQPGEKELGITEDTRPNVSHQHALI